MTVKSLATGVAAVVAIGAAAAGVTSVAPVAPVTSAVQLAVFGIPSPASGRYPRPQAPAVDVPSPDQLAGLLGVLADPAVPAADKSYLVEDGLFPVESTVLDRRMRKAAQNGTLPLSFNVADIAPAGPGTATADITASGPQLEPRTINVRFVDQGGWKLSRSSLITLSQMTSS